jgi:hypothetical protein
LENLFNFVQVSFKRKFAPRCIIRQTNSAGISGSPKDADDPYTHLVAAMTCHRRACAWRSRGAQQQFIKLLAGYFVGQKVLQ